jgi:homoserine O-acetyltransferase
MGGMQVYVCAIEYPDFLELAIPIATCSHMSAIGIAYNDIARQAIVSDPEWQKGFYYPSAGPKRGLSIARMVGMITYRTADLFEQRFGRRLQTEDQRHLYETTFEIESYLRYQGEKLVERFDANSYLYLLKAMDTHDIGRDRGGIDQALKRIQAKVLSVGIHNDLLYPVSHQQELTSRLRDRGIDAKFFSIESIYGHDAFLVEYEKLGRILSPYFAL